MPKGVHTRSPEWIESFRLKQYGNKHNLGKKMSEETKRKIGLANTGKHHPNNALSELGARK